MDILQDTIRTAKKDYSCDGLYYLRSAGCGFNDLTFSQKKIFVQVRKDNGKIKKGSKYRYCYIVDGGDHYSYRSRLDIDQLLNEMNFWED